ncbi:phosphonoacetaldehyde hydrolase [Salinispirillum sp. LH 10-3-1]|uniref:Phosphonoacetaldehyde hydrolase n=1 Tax=Salinispirillum sp. LH 10-3-1 TaxID=2952525 RepID=A0AB38YIF7_9GAMM
MYQYSRRYSGPLEAVILDLAGTCVDFGSRAPILAFQKLFADLDIELSETQARGPMGTEKREHIAQLLALPEIAQQWQARFGHWPSDTDISRLYETFVPVQLKTIQDRTELINGALALQDYCVAANIALAANTGYSRAMAEAVLPSIHTQGLHFSSVVCATEVPRGRPWPHMSLQNALELGVSTLQACVKVDDTGTGIEEGLNAGMWTVAVATSGNAVGLDLDDWQQLSRAEQGVLRRRAYQTLATSGAHYVIDSIADLPATLTLIQHRLTQGEKP